MTGSPPAADGTVYKSVRPWSGNSTFTQADINNGRITYTSTGSASATDTIPFTISDLTNGGSLSSQSYSVSDVAPPTSPGNLAVMQLGNTTTNTTGTVLYLNPSATQSTAVQTIPITQMSFSDSGTSSFLSDTADGSLLAFAAYNTTTYAGSDLGEDTVTGSRGVGTLNSSGTFNLATTYTDKIATGNTTEQTRSATSLDDSTWYITDKDGLYTNNDNNPGGPTGPSLTTNILDTRTFGGMVYVSSTKAVAGVSIVSSPTASSLTALPGLPADGAIQDFYLIRSGSNGATYDVLYTLDQNATNATINKFSLVGANWVSDGTPYTLSGSATAMIAANNGSGGASLYVVTTAQAANNSVELLTDSSGWDAPLNITAPPVTVYTATGGTSLKGIALAPTSLPQFSISATAPGSSTEGTPFNFTLTATNAGPANASNVTVTFTVPAGLTFNSATDMGGNGFTASSAPGAGNTTVVTLSGGTLNADSSDTLLVNVTPAANVTYTVPVGAIVIDPSTATPYIPEGTEFVNYNTSAITLNEADFTIGLSAPSQAYTQGSNALTYTLTAANIGSADANGDVTVQFTLPSSNMTVTGTTGAGFTESQTGEVVTFSNGTLAAGASATLTVTVTDPNAEEVTASPGAAVIDPGDTVPDSGYPNNSSTSTIVTTIFPYFEITGIDVSPVAGTSFTGVVADFQDANDANLADFTAMINWGNGNTSAGTLQPSRPPISSIRQAAPMPST